MPTKINFQNFRFVKSAVSSAQFLFDRPSVAFVGRSNVGKSTLINTLVSCKNLMKTSKTPGLTRQINYALIDDRFYLVDLPGYGYASFERGHFQGLMEDFFSQGPTLKKVYLLIDSRRLLLPADDEFMDYLEQKGVNYSVVFTKCDKLGSSDRHYLDLQKKAIGDATCFECRMDDRHSADDLRRDIELTI